ncbi:MAG TPA: DUF5677 domain-containing protein [Terriglobia bacterium]|nr:DUF5677 domain-containing protein [Terriglobia bacterium]
MTARIVPEGEIEECCERLLEVLAFLRTEFLRVLSKHGLRRGDLTTALAGLAVSAIDSLSAAILALYHFDLSSNGVMVSRFEEHFALMCYFALCDDGEMLSEWFKNPRMVLSERNHKILTAVDAKIANFFTRNQDWSFKERFHAGREEIVHATWRSVEHSLSWAIGRYGLATPEADGWSSLADELKRGRTVLTLATTGPSVSRFIEFLQKIVFTRAEFGEVSPGDAYLSSLDEDIVRWWGSAGQLLGEQESQKRETSESTPSEECERNEGDTKSHDSQAILDEDGAAVFDSEIHRLDWLIQQIEEEVRGSNEPKVAPDLMEVFVVTSTWLNAALTQAKAILMLITRGLPQAIGPAQRALYELWIEWRFLLRHGDRAFNAAKVRMNAMLEALDPFEKQPDTLDPSELAEAKLRLQELEAQYPRVSVEVRAQRGKRKFHWSGMSRSEMERTLGGSVFAYQFLSWDAHGVMGTIRDVSIEVKDGVAHFQFGRQESESGVNRCAWMNGGVLYYMYNDFAHLWGLPPVVLPSK